MISRFFRHLFEALKSLKRNGWMTIAAISSVMITLTLVAIFASVIFNTAKLATDIENNVRVMVYVRKDVEDNSETIVKEAKQSRTMTTTRSTMPSKPCQLLKM